jgi:hypothetical protein
VKEVDAELDGRRDVSCAVERESNEETCSAPRCDALLGVHAHAIEAG